MYAHTAVNPISFRRKLIFIGVMTLWAVVLGPLIGGAPFNWMLYPIVFSYGFGGIAALLGGMLYGLSIVMLAPHSQFTWQTRSLLGAACGALGCLLQTVIVLHSLAGWALMIFGVPAGVVTALIFKQAWIRRWLYGRHARPAVVAGEAHLSAGGRHI